MIRGTPKLSRRGPQRGLDSGLLHIPSANDAASAVNDADNDASCGGPRGLCGLISPSTFTFLVGRLMTLRFVSLRKTRRSHRALRR